MGCAMNTIYAPDDTNTFIAQIEAKQMYPSSHGKVLLFLRYIDKCFMIWDGTKEELILLIDEPTKRLKNLKFD